MVAIIVPTKDRSQFINRLLSYYAKNGCKHKIYIADSSSQKEHIDHIKETINKLSKQLEVIYSHYPKTNIEEAKRLILDQHVDENYSAYCGDDDFLVPSTLDKCADFLDKNSDYSNCHGEALIFNTEGDPLTGPIQSVVDYRLSSNELSDPLERLKHYLNNYWPIWSVRRTDEFKHSLECLRSINVESFREITMGCLPMIYGKTKTIDSLYVVRQMHESRHKEPNPVSAFLSKDWQLAYEEMLSVLIEKLYEDFSLDKEICAKSIEESFGIYYAEVLEARLQTKDKRIHPIFASKSFLKNNFKYLYKIYLKYISKSTNIEKLRSRKAEKYAEFNKIDDFIEGYKK